MTKSDFEPVGGRASQERAKTLAAFLRVAVLISLVLTVRGVYPMVSLLAVAAIRAAVLVLCTRRQSRRCRL